VLIFVDKQLDAQFFFMYIYFYSLHISGSHVRLFTTSILCVHFLNFVGKLQTEVQSKQTLYIPNTVSCL